MRMSAVPSTFLRRAAAVLLFGLALSAQAADEPATTPVIGKTSLTEAREMWQNSGAVVVSEGHLAIGGGSGVDGLSTVGLDQVLLVTVDGVDFESLPVARYAFVDEVLYAMSAQLNNLYKKKMAFKEMSDADVTQLLQTLTTKYGKPRALRDIFAGKKPNTFVWDLRDREMVLTAGSAINHQLSVRNKALQKKVDAYTKAECKKHRQKGETATPVTSICL
jgi:hypothetical protein